MNKKILLGIVFLALAVAFGWFSNNPRQMVVNPAPALAKSPVTSAVPDEQVKEEDREVQDDSMDEEHLAEAKDKLSPEQFNVCVLGGTERPFDNKYYNHHADGSYHCIVCDAELFASDTKYDSGSGWPAFYDAIDTGKIREVEDKSHGMVRTEVRCGECDAHLGHLFTDGPQPTGMRYCINSASLQFHGSGEPAENTAEPAVEMSGEYLETARGKLSEEQYKVCVLAGTERSFDNEYFDNKQPGTYNCIVCSTPLFTSGDKYDSGTGWPSFFDEIEEGRVRRMWKTGLKRLPVEIRCAECDSHLGHQFTDGPEPTGMRYCINSASLEFEGAGDPESGN